MNDPKNRIISHMNEDHQLSLLDYVVVYGGESVSQVDPESVIITDVSEEYLALSYSKGKDNNYSLNLVWDEVPENDLVMVNNMGDIKAKLISMAKYAAGKQGYSHKRVDEVVFPTSIDLLLMFILFVVILAILYDKMLIRRLLQKNSILSAIVAQSPEFLARSYTYFESYINEIASALFFIHFVEIMTVTWPQATKLRMSLKNKLVWASMNFIEGFLVFNRLKKLAE